MKLLNSFGPNPRLVRMFMLEKGITLDVQEHDLMGAENRRPPYTDKNPAGQLPSLELDDGTVIAETVATPPQRPSRSPTCCVPTRASRRIWVSPRRRGRG